MRSVPSSSAAGAGCLPIPLPAPKLPRFYSLIETAKVNNLLLEDYIEHLLNVLPDRLASDPNADIDVLLPWAEDMQKRLALG